jgi:hypothetical protein
MEKYIRRENVTLLRKRLAEMQDEATRNVIGNTRTAASIGQSPDAR